MRAPRTLLSVIAVTAALGIAASGTAVSPVHAQHAQAAAKKIVTTEANGHYVFKAKNVTIAVGTKVTWTNTSDAPHTVTFKTGATFDKNLSTGATLSHTFKKAGTYSYFCKYHAGMVGKIIVK